MKQLGTIYLYELKKILRKKLVWVAFALCVIDIIVETVLSLGGKYYVDGEAVDTWRHVRLVEKEYQKALTGRKIDQELLEEMAEGYGKIPEVEGHYSMTEEYQKYARPYSAIFDFVMKWSGMYAAEALKWKPDEQALYAAREEGMRAEWQRAFLSAGEKEFWQEKNAQLSLPLMWQYKEGYLNLLYEFQTGGLLMLLFVSLSLAGVFAEEHTRRTDSLLLTCAKGKNLAYWAKMLAGVSVAAVYSLLLSALMFLVELAACGTEGFYAEIQFYLPGYSYPLTLGEACLIAYGILLLTSIFVSIIVMVLSERLRSSIAALAIVFGFIIAGPIIAIPGEYRAAAQLWDWLPTAFLSISNVFDMRTLGVFGHYLVSWQAVPVIYLTCGAALVFVGRRVYGSYQVEGR